MHTSAAALQCQQQDGVAAAEVATLHRTKGRLGVRGMGSALKGQPPVGVSLLPEAKTKYDIVCGQFHN